MLKNILFDLGHVIIDIDFERTIHAFRSLGATNFFVDLDQTDPIFYDLEVGNIEPGAFIDYWKKRCKSNDDSEIIDAWNALLIGIKPEVFSILERLKSQYDLYVYSNTNAIHIHWVKQYLDREHGMPDWVPNIFIAAYYSHQLGHRKPDYEGFLAIMHEQKIKPSETLFIDDHLPNIAAAMKLGFHTLHKPAHVNTVDAIYKNKLL